MSTNKLNTGMLAFARSIQLSEALLWARRSDESLTKEEKAGKAEHLVPIVLEDKGVRGQVSQDGAGDKAGNSNPQSVDMAVIPSGYDTFVISFTARILGSVMAPHATDSSDAATAFAGLSNAYAERGGFEYLAERYIWNILNGRFAWRNRMQTDEATVEIRFADRTLTANALELDLDAFPGRAVLAEALIGDTAKADLEAFIAGFVAGLTNGDAFEFSVRWIAKMHQGAEVFPSQEYLRAELAEKPAYKDRSRIYASVPSFLGDKQQRQASIHSQKLNAAIRHIDEWHNNGEYGAIAVNPYGGVQETGEVLRKPKSGTAPSFYDIVDGDADLIRDLDNAPENMRGETHFFFANLVRGGVLGRSKDVMAAEKKKRDAAQSKSKPAKKD